MTTAVSTPTTSRGVVVSAPTARRNDLDGLRAFAILLVVAYHVWVGRVSGGVDVFLLMSSFFMTASLVRRAEAGTIGLGSYWVNRFWRLVPTAAVTILLVLIGTYLFIPAEQWESIWDQSVSSLFYWQNVQLATDSVDYYARDGQTLSPLLHFWSLSIQGQVFILWPVAILALLGLARLVRLPERPVVLGGFIAIFVVSLGYSIITTTVSQSTAYYDTGARLWEFALGSIVALLPLRALPRVAAEILGWGGVLALLSCGIVLDVRAGFPGYLALWPCLAAVAIIIAGTRQGTSFAAFLGAKPLSWLGRIAYPLYLVHWPILVFWLAYSGAESAGAGVGTIIVVASLGLATVIHYVIEQPLMKLRFSGTNSILGLVSILAVTSIVIGPLIAWKAAEQLRVEQLAASAVHHGAYALTLPDDVVERMADIETVPVASQLEQEWVSLSQECSGTCAPMDQLLEGSCSQTLGSPGAPTILVVGDSHAQQWLGVLAPLAENRGWSVVALLKGGCSFAADEDTLSGDGMCAPWREAAVDYVKQVEPAAMFGLGTKSIADSDQERALRGLDDTIAEVSAFVGTIVLVRDNPRFDENMYSCAAGSADATSECGRLLDDVMAPANPAEYLASDQVKVIDLTDYLCPVGICEPVIGNIAVYLDDNHLTAMYARSMSFALDAALRDQGFEW